MKQLLKSLFFAGIVLLIAGSCQKEDALPEPTTSGLNTFGCKVNGKAWIPDGTPAGKNPGVKPITIEFSRVKADTFYLFIHTGASTQERVQLTLPRATLGVNVLKDWGSNPSAFAVYYDDINFRLFYPSGPNAGKVVITRLDTINHIVSGTFEFEGQEILQKQKVSITEGRFDLNLKTL